MESVWKRLRHYVSPVYLMLLAASLVLWYISKLGYTYTTELPVRLNVDGERFDVACVVEGVGTNLFGYRVYMNKRLRIPLSELAYTPSPEEGHEGRICIDAQSLQNAISLRISDIKIISVGEVPEIVKPEPQP